MLHIAIHCVACAGSACYRATRDPHPSAKVHTLIHGSSIAVLWFWVPQPGKSPLQKLLDGRSLWRGDKGSGVFPLYYELCIVIAIQFLSFLRPWREPFWEVAYRCSEGRLRHDLIRQRSMQHLMDESQSLIWTAFPKKTDVLLEQSFNRLSGTHVFYRVLDSSKMKESA